MKNEEFVGKEIYIIQTAKAGGKFRDVTPDYECFDGYANEKTALEALADWMTTRFSEWITMNDENGIEKATENILNGISFDDGNGNIWQVTSKLFDELVGIDEFDTEESADDKIRNATICEK